MDTEESIETKCENLMTLVVLSRKHFSKKCREYGEKCSIVENRLLNYKLGIYKNSELKHAIPDNEENANEIDKFMIELAEKQKRIEDLKAKIVNTQAVVMQLKSDNIGRMLREPLDPMVMLAHAKEKKL